MRVLYKRKTANRAEAPVRNAPAEREEAEDFAVADADPVVPVAVAVEVPAVVALCVRAKEITSVDVIR